VSLRRLPAPPERGGPGGLVFLADSVAGSGVEEGAGGGWPAATGLRDAHPETTLRTEISKTIKTASLKERIRKKLRVAGNGCELHCWPCCRGVAPFTGGLVDTRIVPVLLRMSVFRRSGLATRGPRFQLSRSIGQQF
jgi:hypothetical protein